VHDVDRSPLALNCAPALRFCRLIVSLRFVRGRIGLAAAKIRMAAGDAPSAIVAPARIDRRLRALRRRFVHRRSRQCSPSNRQVQGQAQRDASLEFSFPSALTGHAALLSTATCSSCPASTVRSCRRPCGFSQCVGSSHPPRIPQPGRANSTTSERFAAPPTAGYASPPFLFGDVPLPADSGPRDRVGFESPKRRDRDLIFRWGRCLANINSPKSKLRPTIRRGCVVGDSPDSTHGIFTLRRFAPDVRRRRRLHRPGPACRSPIAPAINFRRGIVRPRKLGVRKRTNDQ